MLKQHNKRGNTKLFSVLLLISAVVFSLVIAEILTRLIFPAPLEVQMFYSNNHGSIFDKTLGWRNSPGLIQKSRNTEGEVITVRTNSYGFRGDEPATKNVYVPFVGDSMTFGLNANTSFPEQFSIISRQVTVNTGVAGYGTDQSFLMMKRAIEEFQFRPRYVVYGFYFNDIINNMFDVSIHTESPMRIHKPKLNLDTDLYEEANIVKNDVTRNIVKPGTGVLFYELIMRSKFLWALSRVVKYDVIGYVDSRRENPINDTSLQYLRSNLDHFVSYTRLKGIGFILLHIPSNMDPVLDGKLGKILNKYALEKNIPYVRPELGRDGYLKRNAHLSSNGAAKVATALRDVIR